MSRSHHSYVALLLVLSVGACATGGPTVRSDDNTTRADLARLTQRFVDAMKASDVETPVSLWTEDAWVAPPGMQPLQGREGVRRWFRDTYAAGRITNLAFHPTEVRVHGDYAYETGHFVLSLQPSGGGAMMNDQGHYFIEWHRGTDAQWRARREVWNSAVPVPAR